MTLQVRMTKQQEELKKQLSGCRGHGQRKRTMTKTKFIHVKMSEEEHEQTKAKAERAGFSSVSEYVRWLIRNYKQQ